MRIDRLTLDEMETCAIDACVADCLAGASDYLEATRQHGSPLYLLEPEALRRSAAAFRGAFASVLPGVRVYYAMKSNNHPTVARTLVGEGLGLDVSSGLELEMAIAAGATDIIFSGPGKTDAELQQAVAAADRVVVLLDSFGELERLRKAAKARSVPVRAGARLTTNASGLWRKFGIPIERIQDLLVAADSCGHVDLQGLQYHMSWSLDPGLQVDFIRNLGDALASLPQGLRQRIRFLDIGGGFWPPEGEWLHADPEAMLAASPAARNNAVGGGSHPPAPLVRPASQIEEFADEIAGALERHVFPHLRCRIHVEPGRWLCNDAMHLLVTVVDKKADDLVIVDAGTNAIGWERFESDYFPVVNLSRPGTHEHVCTIFGSLCTPRDVWGFSYHGTGIEVGDVLLIPRQGAYTFSLRQEFIKPLPTVVARASGGWTR